MIVAFCGEYSRIAASISFSTMFCKTKIDSQMDLTAVARRAFLSAIRHDLLPGAIVFDEAITILPMKVFLHRRFHALDATMFEIGKSDDVAKHRAVWVNASGIVFEINSTQILRAKFFPRARACASGTSRLMTMYRRSLLNFSATSAVGTPESFADKVDDRFPVVKMRGVGHYRFEQECYARELRCSHRRIVPRSA